MRFNTNKEKGNTGLGIAIAYYTSNGYIVSIPLNDTQDYDLIVDNGNNLLKVQVKTSKFKNSYGIYQVSLRTCGGNRSGQTIKKFNENSSNLLFVLLENGEMYLIPKEDIKGSTSINLGVSMSKYKIVL